MKRLLIGGKDFQPSIGQGEQAQGGVIGGLPREVVSCVCSLEGEGGEWMCEKFLVFMCEKCCSWEKNMCKQKPWGEVMCSK